MSKKQEKKDGKGTTAQKAVKENGTPAKGKAHEEPRVTKKSIVIELVSRKGGATVEEMGEAMVKAKLGDLDRNTKTARLWLPKIGFKVVRSKDGKYSKA